MITLLLSTSVFSEEKDLKYCTSKSIWKHAANKGESNSSNFDNIKIAIKNGYCGIELDIIYDENENLIYISHDHLPSSKKINSILEILTK